MASATVSTVGALDAVDNEDKVSLDNVNRIVFEYHKNVDGGTLTPQAFKYTVHFDLGDGLLDITQLFVALYACHEVDEVHWATTDSGHVRMQVEVWKKEFIGTEKHAYTRMIINPVRSRELFLSWCSENDPSATGIIPENWWPTIDAMCSVVYENRQDLPIQHLVVHYENQPDIAFAIVGCPSVSMADLTEMQQHAAKVGLDVTFEFGVVDGESQLTFHPVFRLE